MVDSITNAPSNASLKLDFQLLDASMHRLRSAADELAILGPTSLAEPIAMYVRATRALADRSNAG
jgi:hypothetical protein